MAGLSGRRHRRHHADQPADRHGHRVGQNSAVSSLAYADRVYQLPLGVVGIAVAIVLLPELARALRSGNLKEAANLQNRSVEFTLFLTLPAAAALLVISEPIVRVLYERGAFAASNSTPTVSAILAIFGIGLPAFVLIKAFTPGYFAREDTRTPMIFAAISVAVNVAMALTLFPADRRAGHRRRLGRRRLGQCAAAARRPGPARALEPRCRPDEAHSAALLAAALMAGALYAAADYFSANLASASPLHIQAATLALISLGGLVIYLAVALVTGGVDPGMIRRGLGRSGRAAPPAA